MNCSNCKKFKVCGFIRDMQILADDYPDMLKYSSVCPDLRSLAASICREFETISV